MLSLDASTDPDVPMKSLRHVHLFTHRIRRWCNDRRNADGLRRWRQRYGFVPRVDRVTSFGFKPFYGRCVHVHFLDDFPPAQSCVVGAEGYLSHLCRVWNDTHLCTTKIVIEKVLEPHAGDKKHAPFMACGFSESHMTTGMTINHLQ